MFIRKEWVEESKSGWSARRMAKLLKNFCVEQKK